MPINVAQINHIKYVKKPDDITERQIIPFNVPPTYAKSLDVTELSEADQKAMQLAVSKYHDYLQVQQRLTMSFEDFVKLMKLKVDTDNLKYRNFTVSKIETD